MEVEDQSEVIAFLSRPQTYGESGLVEVIETHAARVFLAGERAYKLKRAVRYPFLDFSTAHKRRAACAAELRLNRRTARELYLELRAVRRGADGALCFDAGEPVDWLVVMRRFAARDLLRAVARRGELDARLVNELADRIAAFHDEATIRRGGGSEGPRAVIEGNLASMQALGAHPLDADSCAALHARSMAMLGVVAPLLERRARHGHVRHCHSDLHLANICLWNGRPTLFDCLEFDPGLATIDVLYDLAFVLMDLWHGGWRAQAAWLFNRYLDMRDGEADGVSALPLFLSMRAGVRAHVEAEAAAGHQGASGEEQRQAARGYLAFARSVLDQEAPVLVAVGGLSGTGKSTLAAALVADIGDAPGARWLRSDVVRKRLHGVSLETRLPPEVYGAATGEAVYARLLAGARAMLAQGRSVIVDAVFARADEREALAALASAAGVRLCGLWLAAPAAILRERVAGRRDDASDADVAVLERQLGYPLGDLADWHRLGAAGSPEQTRAAALAVLARRR